MPRSKLLLPLSFLYNSAVNLRNFLYDKKYLKVKKLPIPVISVGNISAGGTGKTSFTIYLANLLKSKRVCILLRGYRRKSRGVKLVSEYGNIKTNWKEAGDEAFLLAKLLPFASVVVSEDRYRGGIFAIEKLSPDVIILDDGFQHRKLYRDLDIVLIKKKDLKDKILPYGNLREDINSIKRADIVVLSYQEVAPFDFETGKPTFKMFRKFNSVIDSEFKKYPIEILKGKKLIAFSGLGDNEQFFKALENLGLNVKKFLSFPDHYDYKNFKPKKEEIYITTPKDIIKVKNAKNVYALNFEVEVKEEEKLKEIIYRIFC